MEFDALPRLSQVRCPALLIAGDRDLTVPLAAKEALHAGLPDSQLYVVADSGHATPFDQPELFNRLILEFVHAHR